MKRMFVAGITLALCLVGVSVASATNHPSYQRTGGSCKAGYHGVTAKHNVTVEQLQKNGTFKKIIVSKRYVECVWTVIQKPPVTTTVTTTTQPAPVDTTTTTTVPPVTTTTAPPEPPTAPPVTTTTTSTTTTTQPPVTTTSTTTTSTTTTSTTTTTTLAPVTNNVATEVQCAESGGFCSEYNSSAETTGADANVYAGPEIDNTSPQVGTVTFTSADHIVVCTATVYSAADLPSNNARCTGNGGPFAGPLQVAYSGGTVVNGNVTTIYGSSTTSGGSN